MVTNLTRIPPEEVCYRDGEKATLRERDNKGNWTGKYVCKLCYNVKYRHGTYEKYEYSGDRFRSDRIINGKGKTIIVDKGGNIINNNPTKEELKGLGMEPYKIKIKVSLKTYTDEELLYALYMYKEEYGTPPTYEDLENNPNYPSHKPYIDRWGSLENAKKLIGQDLDSMTIEGIARTTNQKGRLAEKYVLKNIEKGARDLSGENCKNSVDGISEISKGKTYDVKSSKLHKGKNWGFDLDKCVDFYYLLAYDEYRNNILHKWKISGCFAHGHIVIGFNNSYRYNLENMKEFEILEVEL